jgi:hypothetical protein
MGFGWQPQACPARLGIRGGLPAPMMRKMAVVSSARQSALGNVVRVPVPKRLKCAGSSRPGAQCSILRAMHVSKRSATKICNAHKFLFCETLCHYHQCRLEPTAKETITTLPEAPTREVETRTTVSVFGGGRLAIPSRPHGYHRACGEWFTLNTPPA